MNLEEVKSRLQSKSISIVKEERLPNDSGTKITCNQGQIVIVYDSGKVVPQGKNQESIKQILNLAFSGESNTQVNGARNVFVVYGHDQNARTELEAMLRRWDLKPIFLDQLPSQGQTIIEKLEHYRDQAKFAVVLATPDDEGNRTGKPDEKAFRARQNVVLEMGMMLAHMGRNKVAILLKDQEKMERPSDIQGLLYIPFKNDLKEAALTLAKEMNAQGLKIDITNL